jgi:murein peptide amidase A
MTRFLIPILLVLHTSAALAEPGAIDAWCDVLGTRLRSVSAETCRTQNYVAAKDLTAKGNSLVYRDIPAAQTRNPDVKAKRVLVIGGIHGDELTSISIVFRWLELSQQPDAADYDWRMIPVANPDGFKARPSTRVNGNGVDINRNFPTPDWKKDAETYWIKRTKRDPRRNPGKVAGSEIETRWLIAEIEDYKPDLIISVHAPYNLLDYDGPVPKPLRFGRLSLNRIGVYPGSLGNYGGLYKQIPVITIELPNAVAMPSQRDQLALWQDMLAWIKGNLTPAP